MTLEFNDQKFKNIINTIMLGQHENIVQFLGYCYYSEGVAIEYRNELVMAEKQERLLCFQYLSNGSFDRYITGMVHKRRTRTQSCCESILLFENFTNFTRNTI